MGTDCLMKASVRSLAFAKVLYTLWLHSSWYNSVVPAQLPTSLCTRMLSLIASGMAYDSPPFNLSFVISSCHFRNREGNWRRFAGVLILSIASCLVKRSGPVMREYSWHKSFHAKIPSQPLH